MSKTRSVVLAAFVAAILVPGTVHAQEWSGSAQDVWRTAERNAQTITSWAYPSVTFRGFDGCVWNASIQSLACRFRYADVFGDAAARMLVFGLDESGLISSIRDGGGDSVFRPFTMLRTVKGLLADWAKQELRNRADEGDEARQALLNLLADSPQPEDVLRFLLNVDLVVGA